MTSEIPGACLIAHRKIAFIAIADLTRTFYVVGLTLQDHPPLGCIAEVGVENWSSQPI